MIAVCRTLVPMLLILHFGVAAYSDDKGYVKAKDWHKARPKGKAREGVAGRMSEQVKAIKVGNASNFSQEFEWNRKSEEIKLAIYINAADPYGVCISNLKKGDAIQITSARGNCRFTKGNGVKEIVSFLCVAAATAITAEEAPELIPTVQKATKFATEKFIPSSKGLLRDPYGYDEGTGDYCHDEGGVIVSLPGAGGIFHMQPDGHVRGSNKDPRKDDKRPPHVGKNGFYLVKGDLAHNTRTLDQDGEVFLLAWDWADKFDDNTGFYEVRMKITRGK